MSQVTLPISRLVSVGISLSPLAAQSQNLNSLLILGTSAVIDAKSRMRIYSSLAAVAADFGSTAEEYLSAVLWFEQSPQPSGNLLIGRWCKTAASGQLIGAPLSAAQQAIGNWNAIANGSLKVTIDGGSPQTITGINLASPAVTNMNGVASAVSALLTGAVCTWNASLGCFVITSNSTGATSQVSFASVTGSGTDLSAGMGLQSSTTSGVYQAPGVAAETALAALTLFDSQFGQQWYAVKIPSAADSDHIACLAYCDASNTAHFYSIGTQEGGVLVSSSTTDIAALAQAAANNHGMVQFSSSTPYADVSALARILSVNYSGTNTAITLAWKQEPGVVAENLTSSQIAALEGKNCNVFVNYNNGTAILEPGVCPSGQYVDTIMGVDAFKVLLQTALYNVLYTSTTKVPQTDSGMHQLVTAAEQVCTQFVNNGLFAPGVWSYNGFGSLNTGDLLNKGYYVYAPPVAAQSASDRAARKSTLLQIAVKLAGAVQSVQLQVTVSQ